MLGLDRDLIFQGIFMGDFDIVTFLKKAVSAGASDEHLKAGRIPYIRKNGKIIPTTEPPLSTENIHQAIETLAPEYIMSKYKNVCDLDFSYEIKGFARFRINCNKQLGVPSLVIRNIPVKIPTTEQLFLPEITRKITNFQNGLVLVTGATGSGKSTTIASLISEICKNSKKHIITIEDPVEFVFPSAQSIVSQRQVMIDTLSFKDGIKYALRQDPDVIYIGEIRDRETMEAAITAAETGHLVFSTLHTNDAVQTINRIINLFDVADRNFVRTRLADILRVTFAQQLIYSSTKQQRFPACEVMLVTPAVRDYILKDNFDEIYKLLEEHSGNDMISMNESLYLLVKKGLISQPEALEYSPDENALTNLFKGIYQGTNIYYEQ